ncbi:DUF4436 domain-containing protein [Leptospira yanagawae]|uniref:DUF4436 domain-containing protein n=1 Tax=Leptospira yanagawae TaxID=293069 RepID=A0ABY2M1G0_9LEPT|nr:DUF4436 family protein [Leptospira yanagawae]TGL21062.1 DUF4436 domain-containing protein [Leptospira yanagawae]
MNSLKNLVSSNRFQLIFLILILITGSYISSVRYFIKDKSDFASFTDVDIDHVKTSVIHADVRSIEIEKREAKVELRIYLAEDLSLNRRSDTPKEDLRLISYSSNEEFNFKAKQPIRKILITLPLVGTVTDYPFDQFQSTISLGFFKKSSELDYIGIPIVFNMQSPIASYKLEFLDKPVEDFWIDRSTGNVDRLIQVERTKSNQFVSVFIMVTMFCIGLITILITTRILLYQKEIHVSELFLFALLVLVLPAIRNAQPGIPGFGVLSDYLSFFWALGLTIISLLVLIIDWHFLKTTSREKTHQS